MDLPRLGELGYDELVAEATKNVKAEKTNRPSTASTNVVPDSAVDAELSVSSHITACSYRKLNRLKSPIPTSIAYVESHTSHNMYCSLWTYTSFWDVSLIKGVSSWENTPVKILFYEQAHKNCKIES